MIALDANVLVYAYDRGHARERTIARSVIHRGDSVRLFVPGQCLAEFVRAAQRKLGISRTDAIGAVEAFNKVFQVGFATAQDLADALMAHRDHLIPIFDAMVWATAKAAGCRHLLTQDFQDGRTLGGVTFVNPFNPTNAELVNRLLPPVT